MINQIREIVFRVRNSIMKKIPARDKLIHFSIAAFFCAVANLFFSIYFAVILTLLLAALWEVVIDHLLRIGVASKEDFYASATGTLLVILARLGG